MPEKTVKKDSTEVAVKNPYLAEPVNILLAELQKPLKENQLVDLFKAFDDLPMENYTNLSNTYKKFDKGVVYNVIVTGISTIDNQFKNEKNPDELTEVVEFQCLENGEPKNFINADTVFVGDVKRLYSKFANAPYFVLRIINEGAVKGSKGTYQRISISQLAA